MKQPPRFAMSLPPDADGVARTSPEEAHHMRDVMRLRPGDAVVLVDEAGASYAGTIAGFDHQGALVRVSSRDASGQRPTLIVAPAVVKGPRMDSLVEKAAELGATELWPTVCARCVGKAPGAERISRWRRLATAASKQSLVAPPMQVRDAADFASLIRNVPRDTLALICCAGAAPMLETLTGLQANGLLIASGPEGDFAPEELQSATAAGFIPVGLGPNRLRSETAAIAAIAIAHQWLNRPS